MRRSYIFLLLLTSLGFAADFNEQSPRVLIHLLDYIAMDYPGAVQRGRVINKPEFDEQIDFADSALKTAESLDGVKDSPEILSGLKDVRTLVGEKAEAEVVAKKCREVEGLILKKTGLAVAPLRWPNIAHGKEIYDRTCASCHGTTGHGDGPSGTNLDPKPSDFHDPKFSDIPPFQLFNTIRLGLPGTGMMAFTDFPDNEVWDLAFYASSLRYRDVPESDALPASVTLMEAATMTDNALRGRTDVPRLRRYVPPANQGDDSLAVGILRLREAVTALKAGDRAGAKQKSIIAYLEGLEPVEPRLRARDSALVLDLEQKMGDVRAAIDAGHSVEMVESRVTAAVDGLNKAQKLLAEQQSSATFTFTVAAGIVLREAFEAALILITLLGVIRTVGSTQAAAFVHGGWISAVLVGIAAWFFSGWLMDMSGAQRETLEGTIALFAVVILLYFGFWLHRKTEIGKWRAFLSEMVSSAVERKKLFALGLISFMAVFREAFETVLFLRALLLESGPSQEFSMLMGVLVSLAVVLIAGAAAVRYSVKIPIRQLFTISSVIMIVLALVLVGKGIHSFQETGMISMTPFPINLRWDLIGLYATYETLVAQLLIAIVSVIVWGVGVKYESNERVPAK